jgi:putative restriction endonuclease
MTKGLFIHRADSVYSDRPAEYYQFPKQYLGRASKFVGDWIIYYEPTKSHANRGYKAVARLDKIVPDPTTPNMYLAMMEPRSYLEFEVVVPFKRDDAIV